MQETVMLSSEECDDWIEIPLAEAEKLEKQGKVWQCSRCACEYDDGLRTFHHTGTSALCLIEIPA